MSDQVQSFLQQMDNELETLGLKGMRKLDNTHALSMGVDYKGVHLVVFNWSNTQPRFTVTMCTRDTPQRAQFEAAVRGMPNAQAVEAYCIKGQRRCQKCGCHPVHPSQLGGWYTVFGRRMNLCAGGGVVHTFDFSQESCDMMKTLLRLDVAILREELTTKADQITI